ncbi:MAG: hypothetical protein WB615_10535 [Candidatus Tumulicola sp.]
MKKLLCAAIAAAAFLPVLAKADIPPEQDAVAISQLVQDNLKVADLDVSMVAEGNFAIAYWKAAGGHSAGEALARKKSGTWVIVRQTAGTLKNAQTLESLGVPATQAKALVADLARAGK